MTITTLDLPVPEDEEWAYSVEFWALPPDGGDAVELADATDWEFAPVDGDWGAIKLSYPPIAPHYGLLEIVTERDRDIEIEIVVGDNLGREKIMRGILYTFDQDDAKNDGLATLTGHFTECLFGETVVPFNPDDIRENPDEDDEGDGAGQGQTHVGGNAGEIAPLFMEAAQRRGALHDVLWRPADLGSQAWTAEHDSRGVPWTNRGSMSFNPGQHYAAVFGTLHGYQLCEWRLTHDRKLLLTNLDGMGVDRTLPGPDQVTLEYGRDFDDAPRRHTVRDAITDLLTSGQDGAYSEAGDATARARRGRRIEGFHSFGNATGGTLAALTERRLGTFTDGKLELSHHLVLGPGSPLPFLDYDVYDWILSDTRRDTTRRRVVQIRLAGDKDNILSASVTLNTMIDEHAVRERRRLEALESGAAVIGTSKPDPDVDDGSVPRPIDATTLAVDTEWYSSPTDGAGQSAAFARWTMVPDSRVESYTVQWRYYQDPITSEWQDGPQVRNGFAAWAGLIPDALMQVRIVTVNRWGRESAPSAAVTVRTARNTSPPPMPSTPTGAHSKLGLLLVPWDGMGQDATSGAPVQMPRTLDRVVVHVSEAANFDVTEDTARDSMLGPSRVGIRVGDQGQYEDGEEYERTFYIRLVAVDREGLESEPTPAVAVQLRPLDDADVEALSIAKLLAGEMRALGTISGEGGIEAVDPATGNRIQMTAAGLTAFRGWGDSPEQRALEYRLAEGILRIRGEYIAQGDVGAEIRIVPSSVPTMYLSSPRGLGPASLNSYDVPGVPGHTGLGINSGPDRGGNFYDYSRLILFPDLATLQILNQDQVNVGGHVQAYRQGVTAGPRRVSQSSPTNPDTGRPSDSERNGGYLELRSGTDEVELGRQIGDGARTRFWIDAQNRARISVDDWTVGMFTGNPPAERGAAFRRVYGLPDQQRGSAAILRSTRRTGTDTFVPGPDVIIMQQSQQWHIADADSAALLKTFVIPHPTDSDRWLVHGCTESPVGGVEYWGTAEVVGGRVVVPLPDYFEALTERDGRGVQVTPIDIPTPRWWQRTPTAWASYPADGQFEIRTRGIPDGGRVSWLVKAARSDASFPVEPRRDQVSVGGDGPYRYLRKVA